MIKNRRKSSTTARRAPARKPTRDDKNVGRQKATRTANLNARRGIQTSNKPSAMDIEREVYRQSRKSMPAAAVATSFRRARRNPKDSTSQVKDRRVKKDQQQKPLAQKIVPVSVGGLKKPPSQTAITAAVEAMSSKGYNVPKGMQMVISFAPAAAPAPSKKTAAQKKKAPNNNNKSKGGGRKN